MSKKLFLIIIDCILKLHFFSFLNINNNRCGKKIVSISQMKRYYKFKLNNPRFYLDLTPSNEQKVLNSDITISLPDRTADGCRVILINTGKRWNPKLISGDEIFRSTILLIEMAINEPKTQVRRRKLEVYDRFDFLFFIKDETLKDEKSRVVC